VILTKGKVKRIIEKALNRAASYFMLQEPPKIDLEMRILPKLKISIDRETQRFKIIVGRFLYLSSKELEVILTYYISKLLSYRRFCPYDVRTAVEIIKQSMKYGEYAVGIITSALLIEIINDANLLHKDPDLVIEAYRIIKKLFGKEIGKTSLLHLCLINKMYGQDVFPIEDKQIAEMAEDLYNIIFTRNVNDPYVWPIIARDVAEYLSKKFGEIDLGSEAEKLGKTTGYDILEEFIPVMAVQTPRRKVLPEAFSTIYGVMGGELSTSAPFLLSTIPMKPKEIMRLWYRERAREIIRITIKERRKVVRQKIDYPDTWELGDSIEKLDVYMSSNISPIMIPGYTTKKWIKGESVPLRVIRYTPDVLIIIDSSGSMGKLHGYRQPRISRGMKKLMKKLNITYVIGSKFDVALLTSFGILEYALDIGCDVAAINFSDRPIVARFGMNKRLIEDVLMIHQNGGTYFPIKTIRRVIGDRKNVLIIVISDAAIYNRKSAGEFLEELSRHHTVYFFHIELPAKYGVLERVRSGGGYIISIPDPDELPKIALTLTEKHIFTEKPQTWEMI